MKEFMKKAAAFIAASMMVITVSASVFAATDAPATSRPRPGSSSSQSTSQSSSSRNNSSDDDDGNEDSSSSRGSNDDDDNSSSSSSSRATDAPAPTPVPAATAAPAAPVQNKSYTTKGGAFLWFLLSVIVNTIISFAIANRFYKLSKRSNHVQSEIRALRRDIEEKFAESVGGFTEPAVDITNTNDDYSESPNGIKMTPASSVSTEDEPEDVYKEWEAQFAARRAERRAAVKARPAQYSADAVDEAEDTDDAPRPGRRKYQPSRNDRQSVKERIAARRAAEAETDDSDDEQEYSSKQGGIGDKAKRLLGGIFPFDNDDE